MTFKEKIKAGKFLVTVEFGPEKGTETQPFIDIGQAIAGRVDGFNVTDLQSAVMRLGSLALCIKLKEAGLEPILQMTCRDRNRLALQSDLLSAASFGIENVLALTGDHPMLGDDHAAKPVFDYDTVQLLTAARKMEQGQDAAGNKLAEPFPRFCLGAVVNPGADPLEPQLIKMEKKVAAGAEFFQTQAVYEVGQFETFIRQAERFKVPVMAGIVLLKNAGMAKYMNEHVSGVHVPDSYIKRMADAPKEQRVAESIAIAAELIGQLKGMCTGIHLMPIGWERHLGKVLDAAGL
jgi:methylenetetrahydrofolate reductase (NADPH)